MSFVEKFSDKISDIAVFIDDNKFLSVIKNAFTTYMPFIIVGSFASLFNSLLCSETVGLASISSLNFLKNLSPAFSVINFATMSIMTLAIVYLIGSMLGKRNEQKELYTGILALISFVTIVPNSITTVVNDIESVINNVLPASSMNAQTLFVGMFIAIVSVELFSTIMKVEKLKIKMPPQVPSNIATSFNTLIPILVTIMVISISGTLFLNFTGKYFSDFIYSILQKPLETAGQTSFGIIFLALAMTIFWSLGIHGSLVILPILSPLALSGLANNIAAVESGGVATNALTMTFFRIFVVAGGAGITISLILALLIFSKRQDQKEVAKLALLPGIFGINEPIIFGLPIILNPVFAVPFILSQLCAAGIAYFATVVGFIPCAVVEVPFGLPLFVNAFIGLQTVNAIIIQAIIIAVAFLIYVPFVKISNKMYEKELEGQEELVNNEQRIS